MLYRVKYCLLLVGIVMGALTLAGCMLIMMPLMMAPAGGNEVADSPDRASEKLIQKGLRELDANKERYDRILLRRVETDDPTLSEQKLRQMIEAQAAVLDFQILEDPAGEEPSNREEGPLSARDRLAILDSGFFKADSGDILHLKLTDYHTEHLIWERRLIGHARKGQAGPGH